MSSESHIQSLARLRLAAKGWHMFRNNVGVLIDRTGRPVRFGLANDSKAANAAFKSGDLIGFDPWGRFASVECKRPGGVIMPAQIAWRDLVIANGGYAIIIESPDELP